MVEQLKTQIGNDIKTDTIKEVIYPYKKGNNNHYFCLQSYFEEDGNYYICPKCNKINIISKTPCVCKKKYLKTATKIPLYKAYRVEDRKSVV